MTHSTQPTTDVVIVGAGPVGLYTALHLAKAGINVAVFDALDALLDLPRALVHFPIVLEDFKKTGVYDDIVAAGYINTTGVAWRKPGGELLARLDGNPKAVVVQLRQDQTCDILLEHLEKLPNFSITLGAKLESFTQGSEGVQARFLHNGQPLDVHAQFLVGTDGGKSTVRHLLGIPLEGFTWEDFNIIAADIEYDIQERDGWSPANYVVDPVYWAVVSRYGKEKEFRVASGEAKHHEDGWNEEDATQRLRHRLEKIVGPEAAKAKVIRVAPYKSHQRCASRFVEVRVVLAGDAAHLTNPTGGLGLTTGFLDAALLGRLLIRIIQKGEPREDLLNEYNAKRREAFLKYTDPIATQNRKRLVSTDPSDIKEREEYFAHLNAKDMPWILRMFEEESHISSTRDML